MGFLGAPSGVYLRKEARNIVVGDKSLSYGVVTKIVHGKSGAIRIFFDSNHVETYEVSELDRKMYIH